MAPCGARVHDIGTIAVTRQAEGLQYINVLKKMPLETWQKGDSTYNTKNNNFNIFKIWRKNKHSLL